jgi:hypothetical protein
MDEKIKNILIVVALLGLLYYCCCCNKKSTKERFEEGKEKEEPKIVGFSYEELTPQGMSNLIYEKLHSYLPENIASPLAELISVITQGIMNSSLLPTVFKDFLLLTILK